MTTKNYERTFNWGSLISGKTAMLVATCDELVEQEYEDLSVVDTYAPGTLNPKDKLPWWSAIIENQLVVSAEQWNSSFSATSLRCILSREGMVNIYGPGGTPDHTYQITDAGVMREGAQGLGYVNRIRAIGDSLYVCGQSRQVYRFTPGQDDPLAGAWLDVAGAMRQPPPSEPPEDDTDEDALNTWLDDNNAIDLMDIAGTTEDDIYCVGDEVWHWDHWQWTQLTLPTEETLNAIKIVSRDEVYLVGANGALLKGNARDGFVNLSAPEDNQLFTGIEQFNGNLYLASNLGLFVYDPKQQKIEPYKTTLTPDLQDTHVVEARDGVLWSFGFKDLAYFDGTTWTRVYHPDNPPIR